MKALLTLLCLLPLTTFGQRYYDLTRTNALGPTNLVAFEVFPFQTNGTKGITASNLAVTLSQWITGGSATNAVTGIRTNGGTISTAARGLDLIAGQFIMLLATNNAGEVTIQIVGQGPATNGNQFLGVPLTLKSGLLVTNLNAKGGTHVEDIYSENQVNGDQLVATNLLRSLLNAQISGSVGANSAFVTNTLSVATNSTGDKLQVHGNTRFNGTNAMRTVHLTGGQTGGALIYANTATNLASVSIGSGLSLAGGTLSATGGGGSGVSSNSSQFGPSVVLTVKNGALFTNALTYGLLSGTLTPGRAVSINAFGYFTNSPGVTETELEYLDGVTSPIQTQLNQKQFGSSILTNLSVLSSTNQLVYTNDAWLLRRGSNGVVVTAGTGISVTSAGSAGQQTFTIGATGGGGSGALQTNSSQFGASLILTLKSGLSVTNLNSKGSTLVQDLYSENQVNGDQLIATNLLRSLLNAQVAGSVGSGREFVTNTLSVATNSTGDAFQVAGSSRLNGKTTVAGGVVLPNITASRALVINSVGDVTNSSGVTTTEMEYLDGVTSSIQAQLNTKQNGNGILTNLSVLSSTNQLVYTNDLWLLRRGSNGVVVAAGTGVSVVSSGSGGQQTFTVTATGGGGSATNAIGTLNGNGTNLTIRGWQHNSGPTTNDDTAYFLGTLLGQVISAPSILGSGVVNQFGGIDFTNSARFLERNAGGNYVAIQAPVSLNSNLTFTMPSSNGLRQALSSDPSGNLIWTNFPVISVALTNGTQFGPSTTLTIKDGALLTNTIFLGDSTAFLDLVGFGDDVLFNANIGVASNVVAGGNITSILGTNRTKQLHFTGNTIPTNSILWANYLTNVGALTIGTGLSLDSGTLNAAAAISTNGNQFGASIPVTIKDGARITNAVAVGTTVGDIVTANVVSNSVSVPISAFLIGDGFSWYSTNLVGGSLLVPTNLLSGIHYYVSVRSAGFGCTVSNFAAIRWLFMPAGNTSFDGRLSTNGTSVVEIWKDAVTGLTNGNITGPQGAIIIGVGLTAVTNLLTGDITVSNTATASASGSWEPELQEHFMGGTSVTNIGNLGWLKSFTGNDPVFTGASSEPGQIQLTTSTVNSNWCNISLGTSGQMGTLTNYAWTNTWVVEWPGATYYSNSIIRLGFTAAVNDFTNSSTICALVATNGSAVQGPGNWFLVLNNGTAETISDSGVNCGTIQKFTNQLWSATGALGQIGGRINGTLITPISGLTSTQLRPWASLTLADGTGAGAIAKVFTLNYWRFNWVRNYRN